MLKKTILVLLIIAGLAAIVGGYFAYRAFYQPNINLGEKKSQAIFIKTGSTFDDVVNMLQDEGYIINRTSFIWLAKKMDYDKNVKPGKYRILAKMGNRALIRLLRSGNQEAVDIPLDNIHTKEQLVTRVCIRLEADSVDLKKMLDDEHFTNKYGFTPTTIMALFIANTYRFDWNTSSEQFIARMAEEYKKFWTEERKAKAKKLKLSQSEIITLAAIVEMEQSNFDDEKPTIAGLYLNRLKIDMPLQSDPTVIFAVGDFTINRVRKGHKEVDSPYNTYMYKGLPPAPIIIPNTGSIDAVLNTPKHDYIYMCAKEDFSGRHYFAKNFEQHLEYARLYHDALDKKGIK